MVRRTHRIQALAVVGALGLTLALAACGSSSKKSTASKSPSTSSSTAANVAAAEAGIAPYTGKPSPFPVTAPLTKRPVGKTFDYMDCGTPVCALFYQLLQPAAKTMGVTLNRVKAGQTANTVTAAFDTAVTTKPAAVITTAITVQLWSHQLKQLQQEHVPIVTTGITGLGPYGVPAPQASENMSTVFGKALADYVAAKISQKANTVFYQTPELPFTLVGAQAYKAELAKVCPGCSARVANISALTFGNTAPQAVVSDLQAHPSTNVAVFASDEAELGLPAALKGAGLKVITMGSAPTPANLAYVKAGTETVTLAYDLPVASWELVDQAAREVEGVPLSGTAAQGIEPIQFLTQKDITFNPALGWTGYPTFPQMFGKLWGVKG